MEFYYKEDALYVAYHYGRFDECVNGILKQIRDVATKENPTESEKGFYAFLQKDEQELTAGLYRLMKREIKSLYARRHIDPPKLSDVERKPFHHNF